MEPMEAHKNHAHHNINSQNQMLVRTYKLLNFLNLLKTINIKYLVLLVFRYATSKLQNVKRPSGKCTDLNKLLANVGVNFLPTLRPAHKLQWNKKRRGRRQRLRTQIIT